MAGIVQAAAWLAEGKSVRRAGLVAKYKVRNASGLIRWIDNDFANHAPFSVHDLQANDLELAPEIDTNA